VGVEGHKARAPLRTVPAQILTPYQLSIYASPSPQVVLVDDPSELEKQIGVVREQATGLYNDGYARAQGVVNHWIGVEHAVECMLHVPVHSTVPNSYPYQPASSRSSRRMSR
jgi:hypothetical protein